MSGKLEAKAVREFKSSAERVFDAWLDPIKVRSWMAQAVQDMPPFDVRRIEIDARVGGKFTFSDMREAGEAVHWGSWFTSEEDEQENSSLVTLTLEPLAGGCRATIVHSMDERWAEYVKRTEMGWSAMLRKIDAVLATEADEDWSVRRPG